MEYHQAKKIAEDLRYELSMFCKRIEIAGSIRRDEMDVEAIDLVCIPEFTSNDNMQKGLVEGSGLYLYISNAFRVTSVDEEHAHIKIGKSTINVNIFIATPETWGYIFLLRTGPTEFSEWVVTELERRGFTPKDGAVWSDEPYGGMTKIATLTERNVFTMIRTGWIAPEHRSDFPNTCAIWKQDKYGKFGIIEGVHPTIGDTIKKWCIVEKMDETNIGERRFARVPNPTTRVVYENGSITDVDITNNAQIPARLLQYLQTTFTESPLGTDFGDGNKVVFLKDGYGVKIREGGRLYQNDNVFVTFTAWVDGWWRFPSRSQEDLTTEIGNKCVSLLEYINIGDAVECVYFHVAHRLAPYDLGL